MPDHQDCRACAALVAAPPPGSAATPSGIAADAARAAATVSGSAPEGPREVTIVAAEAADEAVSRLSRGLPSREAAGSVVAAGGTFFAWPVTSSVPLSSTCAACAAAQPRLPLAVPHGQ